MRPEVKQVLAAVFAVCLFVGLAAFGQRAETPSADIAAPEPAAPAAPEVPDVPGAFFTEADFGMYFITMLSGSAYTQRFSADVLAQTVQTMREQDSFIRVELGEPSTFFFQGAAYELAFEWDGENWIIPTSCEAGTLFGDRPARISLERGTLFIWKADGSEGYQLQR